MGAKTTLHHLYRNSLVLLTDLYELTMAYAYWKSRTESKEAVFNLFFRNNPFDGGFAIACGLDYVIDFLKSFRFEDSDLEYLSQLQGNDGKALFEETFLDYLRSMKFSCDIAAVPEGTVVFAHEPLLRVKGPIIQAQILETALLNMINFQTLIATKAARILVAAGDKEILEFGPRRAQGFDGAVTASRAAYIGGCDATSNVLAGKLFGIPVKGTLAHSWVMSFSNELDAFQAFASAMPNNCVFLVDTYDSIDGIKNAIKAGQWLEEHGHQFAGIRLDSGDLAYLSVEARKLLDKAGFSKAHILASNDLDENIIDSLNDQGALVDSWGVGTKLVTGFNQPALGGVYKLTAVRSPGANWEYCLKLSEQAIKISTPGIQQIRRFYSDGNFMADVIFDESNPPGNGDCIVIDPLDMTRRKRVRAATTFVDLLVPIFQDGRLVYNRPSIGQTKKYTKLQMNSLDPSVKRLLNPHQYPVGLEQKLHELKTSLILKARGYT